MALCKTAVSPLLTHWRYCSLALSHRLTSLWPAAVVVQGKCPARGGDCKPQLRAGRGNWLEDVMTGKVIPHCCHFVRGIHMWLMDSPHKGLVIQRFCRFFVKWEGIILAIYTILPWHGFSPTCSWCKMYCLFVAWCSFGGLGEMHIHSHHS